MKRLACLVVVAVMIVCTLAGCSEAAKDNPMVSFERIETNRGELSVLVDKKTGVMYLYDEEYGHGGLCLIVDSDGRPRVWKSEQ